MYLDKIPIKFKTHRHDAEVEVFGCNIKLKLSGMLFYRVSC